MKPQLIKAVIKNNWNIKLERTVALATEGTGGGGLDYVLLAKSSP